MHAEDQHARTDTHRASVKATHRDSTSAAQHKTQGKRKADRWKIDCERRREEHTSGNSSYEGIYLAYQIIPSTVHNTCTVTVQLPMRVLHGMCYSLPTVRILCLSLTVTNYSSCSHLSYKHCTQC